MHKILQYTAFGWLTFGGTMHFIVDVLSQYLRGKRAPGPETTLYFGLNTAYAMGQLVLGVFGLIIALRAPEILGQWPVVALCLLATIGWLAFGAVFIEYREPKIVAAIFGVLIIAAAAT